MRMDSTGKGGSVFFVLLSISGVCSYLPNTGFLHLIFQSSLLLIIFIALHLPNAVRLGRSHELFFEDWHSPAR